MKPHVLIVDDNRELAENLAELVEDEGCRVSVAYNGEQALALGEAQSYDLVLTDIVMPGINGIELVRRMSQQRPEATYLLMTAYTSEPLLRQAQAINWVRAVLAKPLDVERLLPLLPREPGAQVLLATPDAALAAVLGEGLRAHGYRVETVATAAAAERACAGRPRIAVVDRRIADGDAAELVQSLRDAGVPVVLIQGEEERPAPLRGVHLLARPVSSEQLVSAIRAAMAADVAG